jgi:type I restriction enzyme S subunit
MIPEGWSFRALEEVADVKRGKFSVRPRNDPRYFGGQTPFVQTGDVVSAKKYLTRYSQTLNDDGVSVSKVFPAGTILITIAANIGDTAITAFPVACPDSVVGISPKRGEADCEWLHAVLETKKDDLEAQAPQNAQKNINLEVLKPLQLLTPPYPEQRRIAEFLSTWHRAIETVEALIANARAQRQALMQSLLTGKKRLPGFASAWRDASLDELFTFYRGQGLSKDAVTASGIRPCILYGELYTRYPEVIGEVVGRTNSNEGFPSRTGDILIPASTTTTGIDLANATAIMQSEVLLSGDINVLRPKDQTQSAPFFAYLLTHTMKRAIASRAQGITIVHLYGSDLKPLRVKVPEAEEQHAIAEIILAADGEVARIRSQGAALRQEKSALMQQLLTGKRRVRMDQGEAA